MRTFTLLFLFFAIIATYFSCQTQPYPQGKILYENFCANCHMEDGQGLGELIPPLAGADYLQKYKNTIPCIIRYGIEDTIIVNDVTYSQPMAGIEALNDVEITNVINYINTAWGNEYEAVKLIDIQNALKNCE